MEWSTPARSAGGVGIISSTPPPADGLQWTLQPGAKSGPHRLQVGVDTPTSVLVIEDDDATRSFLADNLAADGFKVATAAGAGEGLRAIEVREPGLVILDLMLADGSGLE